MRSRPLSLLFSSCLLAAVAVGQDPQKAAAEPAEPKAQAEEVKADEEPQAAGPSELGGTIAEDVTIRDLDGEAFRFGEVRGKVVVLHFWSIKCPYEKHAEPRLMQIAEEFGDDVIVLAIAANQGEIGAKPEAAAFEVESDEDKPYRKIREHVEDVGFNHRILVDHGGELARLLNGKSTPHCFVFDAEGVLRYQGALDDDSRGRKGEEATSYVRLAVAALLEGEEVETKSTPPYG